MAKGGRKSQHYEKSKKSKNSYQSTRQEKENRR